MPSQSLLERRYSCRRFAPAPLPSTAIAVLLEAAVAAPSAGNLQPWRFIVVTSAPLRLRLARAARQDFVAEAPVVITVCAVPAESARRYGERGRSLYSVQDTAAATQNILLAATVCGLGSCWVGAFDEEAVRAALGLPTGWRPMALVPVGLPMEEAPPRERKPIEEVTVFRAE
jgi:nitroreductase